MVFLCGTSIQKVENALLEAKKIQSSINALETKEKVLQVKIGALGDDFKARELKLEEINNIRPQKAL